MLLILTDPIRSLPAVTRVIKRFGNLLLYKINEDKSQMIGINISLTLRELISVGSIFSLEKD